LRKSIELFLSRFDDHMQELLRGTSVAFALKMFAAGAAFGLNVVLARLLGADGSGIFFLALTIVLITATIGRIGMENALVRFIATNVSANRPDQIMGVYVKAIRYALITSLILSVLLYLLTPWLSAQVFNKPELEFPLKIMALGVTPLALLILHAHALQGLKQTAAYISVLSLWVPMITAVVSVIWVMDYGIIAASLGYLLATCTTWLIGWWHWCRATRPYCAIAPRFELKELLLSSMPLFGIALMNQVITWSPTLFLGVWESSENVGIYNVANRTAMLTSFVLMAVNSIAAPKFTELIQRGDMKALENLARVSASMMLLISFPLVFVLVVFPEWALLFFGDEFREGSTILVILAIGQFVNVVTGSSGILLIMSGNQKVMKNNMLLSMIVCVLLSLWLIPGYGVVGAAIAGAISLASQNIIAVFMVWKLMNVIALPSFNIH
jgi:O-antigen/teichoic acid export membrane protein